MGTTMRKKAAALAIAFALAMSLIPASMAFAADENSVEGGVHHLTLSSTL